LKKSTFFRGIPYKDFAKYVVFRGGKDTIYFGMVILSKTKACGNWQKCITLHEKSTR
jgi:hypothetical protein